MIDWLIELLGFEIVIQWDADRFVHYAKNREEAFEWLACYPGEALGTVRNMAGHFVMQRQAQL